MSHEYSLNPILINQPQAVDDLLAILSREPVIAVDTESNSLHAYQEQVCLMQFSTPQADYLLDPLALSSDNIKKLAPLFSNPDVHKVFHASEYDIIVLSRDFNFLFANLFDTMWAACILGWNDIGLGAVLESVFHIHVDKKNQRANWGNRPLASDLIRYAALDTHYLISLRDILASELEKADRMELAQEDFTRFCKVNGAAKNTHLDILRANVSQIAEMNRFSRRQISVLYELWLYRDELARARNCPVFKVLPERMLSSIATACPQNLQELTCLPEVNRRLVERYESGILSAVQRGLRSQRENDFLNKLQLPTSYPDAEFNTRMNILRDWRKKTAERIGVKSDVILPRTVMEEIARQNPQRLAELEPIMQDLPWRMKHFGNSIIMTMGGGYV
jgi:ribonuclease D